MVHISPAFGQSMYQINLRGAYRLTVPAFVSVARKDFNGKFTSKINFYVYTITDADVGKSKSLHTLFDKYLDHVRVKFEQNRTVRNT